jgi:hypothetical protein
MRTVVDTKPFCDLAVGDRFRISLFHQTSSAPDLSKPGTRTYVKTGARTYRRANSKIACRARSVLMKTWPPL